MRIENIRLQKLNNCKKTQNSTPPSFRYEENDTKQTFINNPGYQDLSFSSKRKTMTDYKKFAELHRLFTPDAANVYERAQAIAKQSHSKEIESWHLYLSSLIAIKKYLRELDEGVVKYDLDDNFRCATTLFKQQGEISRDVYTNPENRKQLEEIINKHIQIIKKEYVDKDLKNNAIRSVLPAAPSKKLISELAQVWDILANATETNIFFDHYFFVNAIYTQDKKITKLYNKLNRDLGRMFMTDKNIQKDKNHLEFYDNKARAIWKNISLGNNVSVLNDSQNKDSEKYLINSFVNIINKPQENYNNINPEKTNVIVLNKHATFEYLDELIQDINSNESKKGTLNVILINFSTMASHGNTIDYRVIDDIKKSGEIKTDEANTRYIIILSPELYYANMEKESSKMIFDSFSIQSLPVLNASDAKQYLCDENGLNFISAKTKHNYGVETVQKAIEMTSSEDGNYPEKVLKLLSDTSNYFADKDEISPLDVEEFISETRSLNEVSDSGDDINIIFDTGKKLDDIKGSPMTKAEAQSIVKQIKNGTIGIKGYTISLANGSAYGGGRKHTAEAIAGEAEIPMIVFNAKDFALKDIDTLSANANFSELKIKKLISAAKAQAEANKYNTAMVYIENFDNFGSNSLYGISSIYEQKAFSCLLDEMNNARKNNKVNLLIIGSMNIPGLLDDNIMKPYKFLNSIEVYQPQNNEQRKELLEYYIDKLNIEFDEENDKNQEDIIKDFSETLSYFSVVDIMHFLETAKNVAMENDRKKVTSADLTEAFLQTTTGRLNANKEQSLVDKRIVTSHEAGHALALEVMYEIAQKQQIPWHLPDKVNFVTLDPRGWYGGAMYHKPSENSQTSFEKVMSDIICCYGGHSSEKILYNMSGSWGITADMQSADDNAQLAVTEMGMGPRVGVRHISKYNSSEAQKREIEKDINSMLSCGREISDSIIEEYKDFILKFTDKYASKVATGDSIISGKEFSRELQEWRSKLSDDKKARLAELEDRIVDNLDKCKRADAD